MNCTIVVLYVQVVGEVYSFTGVSGVGIRQLGGDLKVQGCSKEVIQYVGNVACT